MAKIVVDRKWKKEDYTIGKLYIDGEYICNTCEDTDRGLSDTMELQQIKTKKIPTRTAIPTGTYEVTLNITSPKFSKKEYYYKFCKGKVPRLLNVKGFEGILIHCGEHAGWSEGCILVGDNTKVGRLTNSQARFEQIYNLLLEAKERGEKIEIEIY
jgi:hypothetical protein